MEKSNGAKGNLAKVENRERESKIGVMIRNVQTPARHLDRIKVTS